jgi:hypothetical protein
MLNGKIRGVVGPNSGLSDRYRDLCFESKGRGISIPRHQGVVSTRLNDGKKTRRSRTDSTSRSPNLAFEFEIAVHPGLQMLLILSTRPFPQLFERNCRSLAISLEQIEHGLRLPQPELRIRLDTARIDLHGVPPRFRPRRPARPIQDPSPGRLISR